MVWCIPLILCFLLLTHQLLELFIACHGNAGTGDCPKNSCSHPFSEAPQAFLTVDTLDNVHRRCISSLLNKLKWHQRRNSADLVPFYQHCQLLELASEFSQCPEGSQLQKQYQLPQHCTARMNRKAAILYVYPRITNVN